MRRGNWLPLTNDAPEPRATAEAGLKAAFGYVRDDGRGAAARGDIRDAPGRRAAKAFVLLHAEVGDGHREPAPITMGYIVTKPDGTVAATKSGTSTLAPMARGTPSPLELTSTLALDPGDYMLKLAVVDGERVGSVERPIHVGFASAGSFTTSDLFVGASPTAAPAARPPVASVVRTGFVQGFFEAYGDGAAALRARFDVLPRDGDTPAATAEIAGQAAGGKAVFSGTVDIARLRPGPYVLRATLLGPSGPLQTLTTGFDRPAR